MITLAGDGRGGSKSREREIEDPTRELIVRSISDLDGCRFTEISVKEEEPFRYLAVAGGPGLYPVTEESAGGEILQMKSPEGGSGLVQLVCGGQMGVFERSSLVTKDQAVDAVTEFLKGFPGAYGDAWSVE